MLYEPVKLAVIGCQGYSLQLIKRILSVPYTGTLAAVMALDPKSEGAEFCRQRGISVFPSVDALLDYGQFEAVFNSTPINLHAPLARQCLKAGFPVFLEKPPVATVQELDALQEASRAAGLPVAVCFNSLHSSLVQTLKKELLAGRFGKIHRVKGIGAWGREPGYFGPGRWHGQATHDGQWVLGGTINNPFSHVLANGLFFAGAQQTALASPRTVEAELYRCNEIETEDTSCLRVMTCEGIEVLTWLTLGPKDEIQPRTVIETEKALITFENFKTLTIDFHDGSVEQHEAYQEDRIQMIEQLCRAIRTGERFLCDLESVRPFTVVVNSAFDSAGSIITIPDQFLRRTNADPAPHTVIEGVGEIMQQAFEANALFSELDVPWARKSTVFDAENYTEFPVRFKPGVLEEDHSEPHRLAALLK
jgi:predicted dehydrogenase